MRRTIAGQAARREAAARRSRQTLGCYCSTTKAASCESAAFQLIVISLVDQLSISST
jgi:hypothetical protein